jgi:hypothetical protein
VARWVDVRLDDPRVTPLGADAMLLTYRGSARRTGEAVPRVVLASSAYVRDGEDWRLVFHQQSPATAPADTSPAGATLPVRVSEASAPRHQASRALRAAAVGATALGALAVGALAVGAVSIGSVAVGALALGRGRVRRLTIDQLEVHRMSIG